VHLKAGRRWPILEPEEDTMKKLDLKKKWKHLYLPSAREPGIVDVPRLKFVMIDGAIEKGKEPSNSPGFAEAIGALYGIAYTLKFTAKLRKQNPIDYPVMALEGLWWVEKGNFDLSVKDNWLYTIMILVPEEITPAMLKASRLQVQEKKGANPALDRVRLDHFREGKCVQMMHIGSYASEPATIEKMRALAAGQGYLDQVGVKGGKHHEIYMGDPRRAKPEKLKTVVRHPIQQA
jgi:hypothetical protein